MSFDLYKSVLFSSNTLANPNTSLYGSGGSPPSGPPSVPNFLTSTPTSISVFFSVIGITGTAPIVYSVAYAQAGGFFNNSVVAVQFSGNIYFATLANLSPGSSYQCKAVASNSAGTKISSISSVFTTPGGSPIAPSGPPSNPVVAPGTPPSTSLVVSFNVAGITGTPSPTYSLLYGPSSPPLLTAVLVNDGSIYTSTISGLTPSTPYYFQAVATNSQGSQSSAIVSGSTSASPVTPPSGPPTVPIVFGSPTANSITVRFDIAGITGNPTPTYSGLYGSSITPTIPVPAVLVSGTLYSITVSGLLPSTTYYFKSLASNGTTIASVSSAGIATASATPLPTLKTNVVLPFLLQGPRFGSTAPWAGLDYYLATPATGAVYNINGTTASGQQLFGSMYAGTVGAPGNLSGDPGNIVPYAGSCTADQVFSFNFGTTSDAYLQGVQNTMGSNGRILACWGGFYADILGLFGPYSPSGYPGTQPTAQQVVQSFLYNYCGITSGNTNPLNWLRQNTTNTSSYNFYFNGLILDFENVGAGNPLNSFPYASTTPPAFPANATNPIYAPYLTALGNIPAQFYAIAPTLFFGNAPVSLSLLADVGTTNICASNSALNTWYAFPTATVAPTVASYNSAPSLALNHPEQLSYMDDVFVQFYNESQPYYPGGQYFPNVLACWGYVALEAQNLGRKKTTINLGLAKGNIIPGGSAPWKASAQGPTPQLNGQAGPPYTYWYPQYATSEPPNNTSVANNPDAWPNTSPVLDPQNVANAILTANNILKSMTGNNNLLVSDWLSGMGFWAGGDATLMCKSIYDKNNSLSPANSGGTAILPHTQTYCWSDASYPAPNPLWVGNVPITANW